ncbi:dihydroorotase [Alteribacillus sp. HJP-4]|uniref:dihydroorotase n=1 Tax=Alteribacillus sp. HJP-4 TaxID=2775394 RepID=UPI0035CCF79D
MSMWIKNAKVYTKEGKLEKLDVEVKDGCFEGMGSAPASAEAVIDAEGKLLSPGLVDVHVHLREPGGEHKETIATGTAAAAKGGFTTICPMPNTRPVPDTAAHMKSLQERIQETAVVPVLPYASITIRQLGDELVDMEALKKEGAFAFTDDGVGIQSAGMMLNAMKKAASLDMAIVAHCEDNTLINKGSVHEGKFSKIHGINGIPSVCESVQIARDVLLAEAAGVHYHVCHVSTKESVRVIRDAKKAGIRVTAEVTPHHLILCEDDMPGLHPDYKMNPPLRSKEDRDALIEGLLDGTLDVIATDHAPHASEEKAVGLEKAPFGITGSDTAFPLLYSQLVKNDICSLEFLLDRLTAAPAKLFNINAGVISKGNAANLTLIDLQHAEEIDPETFLSKGKNTPFTGWSCEGWPVLTMVDGQIVFEKEGALS